MNSYHPIDMAGWPRRNMFAFYRKFEAPCFNISVKIEAAPLYQYAGIHQESFFLMSLYAILRAANQIPQLRQRIIDDVPVEFEKIAVMTPIMTRHELFCQVWCEYFDTFAEFKAEAAPGIERARAGNPAPMENHGEDFLCASCLPWLHFESIAQAEYGFRQSVPILAWGKLEDDRIPISLKASHCFVDGLHVSRFFESVRNSFANPEALTRASE